MSWDQMGDAAAEVERIQAAYATQSPGGTLPAQDVIAGPDTGPNLGAVVWGLRTWRVYAEHPWLVRSVLFGLVGLALVGAILLFREMWT